MLQEDKLIGIGIDITEKKRSEQRTLDINRSLTEKNKEITFTTWAVGFDKDINNKAFEILCKL